MPRDRTFENKVLDETNAFLQKILQDFKKQKTELIFKDYIKHLPARKKLIRLGRTIGQLEELIIEAIAHARREQILSGKFKLPIGKKPLLVKTFLDSEERLLKKIQGERGDCY